MGGKVKEMKGFRNFLVHRYGGIDDKVAFEVIKLEICELEKEDESTWDEYVYDSNTSTFYHQIGWRNVVEKTYKHKPIYLVAKEEGEIKGILHLFLMKSMLFGKKLVLVPFAPYGGVCADNKTIVN